MSAKSARSVRVALSASIAFGAVALVLGGCGQIRHDSVHAPSLRGNLTPELATTGQRPDDVDNALAIMKNANWRMFGEDLGSVWYTDRPSRLHYGVSPR